MKIKKTPQSMRERKIRRSEGICEKNKATKKFVAKKIKEAVCLL
jgi:hypothetical protein